MGAEGAARQRGATGVGVGIGREGSEDPREAEDPGERPAHKGQGTRAVSGPAGEEQSARRA